MIKFAFFGAILIALAGAVIDEETDCGSHPDFELISVAFSECSSFPCIIQAQQEYEMRLTVRFSESSVVRSRISFQFEGFGRIEYDQLDDYIQGDVVTTLIKGGISINSDVEWNITFFWELFRGPTTETLICSHVVGRVFPTIF